MAKRLAAKRNEAAGAPRFDVDMLREMAGEKAFTRGIAYHAGGQVEIVSIARDRVVTKVLGSEIYHSELAIRGDELAGKCSCPAFVDWGFCKHLVATALTANALDPSTLEEATNRFGRIRTHLLAQGTEALVNMIMALAERDSSLLKDLELAAASEVADDASLFSQFKKAITDATRTRGFVEYGDVGSWARGMEGVLDRIECLIDRGRAEMVLKLLDHVFARMEKALEAIDDSDGHAGEVFARGCDIHLKACHKARPEPVMLARWLFAHEMESGWGFFHGASETYADVLGDAGLREYRRLAEEAWRTIKPLRGGDRRIHDDQFGARYTLGDILESFAERDGDVDAQVAIRLKDLSSAYAYLQIAQLCLDHGRKAQALQWAEEGLWQFEDAPDERLIAFTADLYRTEGRQENADKLLWQAFERRPSLELYGRIKAAASDSQAAKAARDRAVAVLRAQMAKVKQQTVPRWSSPADLFIRLTLQEGLLAEAWEAVRSNECDASLLEALAQASEESHPAEALEAFVRRVEQLVGPGGQSNYEDASRIIDRMRIIRERLGETGAHNTYLDNLLRRYKAKRNFVKLLRVQIEGGPIAS